MKTYIYTLLKSFLLLLIICCVENLFAQVDERSNQQLNFSITANPLLIAQNSTPNITISATKKWVAIVLDASYYAATGTDKDFNTEYQKTSLSASIRFYPLNELYNSIIHGRPTNISCPKLQKDDGDVIRPNGIYVSVGFRGENMKYNYIPDSSLQSPLMSFLFAVKNNGIIAEAGYQIIIKFISIDIGYQIFLSFPNITGDVNPFGETIYTNTFPFKYRLQAKVNLQVGFNLTL